MIGISLDALISTILGGTLMTIFFAWLSTEWRRQRSERSLNLTVKCAMCCYGFEVARSAIEKCEIIPCPRCGHLNEARRSPDL